MTYEIKYKVTLTDTERTVVDNICCLLGEISNRYDGDEELIPDVIATRSLLNVLRHEGYLEVR